MTQLFDADLEREYLAKLIIAPDETHRAHTAGAHRVDPADIFRDDHRAILEAIYACTKGDGPRGGVQGLKLELERAQAPARALQTLEMLYGMLSADLPAWRAGEYLDGSYLESAAERLRELARCRRLAARLRQGVLEAENMHAEGALEAAREALGEPDTGEVRTVELHNAALIATAPRVRQRVVARPVYPLLANAYGGLPAGSMMALGGRTGAGKSTLMLGLAMGAAGSGMKPGIVSCEDGEEVWGARALAQVTDRSQEGILFGAGTQTALGGDDIARGIELLKRHGVRISEQGNRPLNQVLRAVRWLITRCGCNLIFVDYLQAIQLGVGPRRHELVANAAQRLKAECQQHGVPLVLGSQLSRPEKSKPFAEPHVSELKESGDLENMSEVVLLLWKSSDSDDARMLGKVAKVKWSPRRPRFELARRPNGALTDLRSYDPPIEDVGGKAWA